MTAVAHYIIVIWEEIVDRTFDGVFFTLDIDASNNASKSGFLFSWIFALDNSGNAFYAAFELFGGKGLAAICAHILFEFREFKVELELLMLKFFEAGLQCRG